MDLATHIILGAAIGEAAFGKKLGNRAPIIGAAASLIPDMDILSTPFFDEVTRLSIHRGITHSLLFMVLLPPLLGWFFKKWDAKGSWKDWSALLFLALAGHVLLDVLTNYGTQIFQPFSNLQVRVGSISVIDAVFTVPVLAGFLAGIRMQRANPKRQLFNWLGLSVGATYLAFTIFNKYHVKTIFEEALQRQGIGYEKFALVPASTGNLFWHGVAQSPEGWYVGDYSLPDHSKDTAFQFFGGEPELLEQLQDQQAVAQLKWYANGIYLVRQEGSIIRMYHTKCHLTKGYEEPDKTPSAGYFELSEMADGKLNVRSLMMMTDKKTMNLYRAKWTRIMGK